MLEAGRDGQPLTLDHIDATTKTCQLSMTLSTYTHTDTIVCDHRYCFTDVTGIIGAILWDILHGGRSVWWILVP